MRIMGDIPTQYKILVSLKTGDESIFSHLPSRIETIYDGIWGWHTSLLFLETFWLVFEPEILVSQMKLGGINVSEGKPKQMRFQYHCT